MNVDGHASHRHNHSRNKDNANRSGPRNGPFLTKAQNQAAHGNALSDDEMLPVSHSGSKKKKKKQTPLPTSAEASGSRAADVSVKRPARMHVDPSRHAPRAQPETQNNSAHIARAGSRAKKDKAKDAKDPGRQPAATAYIAIASDDEEIPSEACTGPLAPAQFSKMKKEIETLKKQLAKSNEKHSKTISDLKRDLATAHKNVKDKHQEMEKFKTKTKQSDEVISSIESHLQCQICIDILAKPFALSPCGHVLCQGCLQDWFRAAPTDVDMDVDEPLPVTLRKKTCPCCRATVRLRPVPLFIVKSLVSTLNKHNQEPSSVARPSPPPDIEDPWAGIFLHPTDAWDAGDEGDDDEDDEDEDGGSDYEVAWGLDDDVADYNDDSDDEYLGAWIRPSWEPPVYPDPTYHDEYDEDQCNLLQRGATYDMIEAYHMTYDHDEGLTAWHDDLCIHLGWNIHLQLEDPDGSMFIDWCLDDMDERSERWLFEEMDAWRLVREDSIEEYADTDTDHWLDDEDEDEDAPEA
ncbi:hypothetical protein EWM64_g364 [Hericium alpestre]|uniref:RING-type domain-containing protein n=1 Tax=Hericium alpestre TaxID=135208 RepID=A0A4Z0A992_9AGAM|nr:hypothetical protein EWM64_g364 [Hericium alpestre]